MTEAPPRCLPTPECPADAVILLLLGDRADLHWGAERYNWHGAQIASWSVPVAACVRCRGEQVGCGGLTERGTTHRKCYPEAWLEG